MNKDLKDTFRITINILIYILSLLMVLGLWLKLDLLLYINITISILGILIGIFGLNDINIKNILKEGNIYYCIVSIIISISILIHNDIMFYIGIILLTLIIIYYIVLLFKERRK